MEALLPTIFFAIIGFAFLCYLILDGYDLGIGMLLPLADGQQKDLMVISIGPFWDANETWFILGIGALFIAFPSAYGIILSELYAPFVVMLLGLILRGISFGFRVKVKDSQKPMWNNLFSVGSLVVASSQGWILGAYITGLTYSNINTLFSALMAIVLPLVYMLFGSLWLLVKTDEQVFEKAHGWAKKLLLPVAIAIITALSFTLLNNTLIFEHWSIIPDAINIMVILLFCIFIYIFLYINLRKDVEQVKTMNPWKLFGSLVAICTLLAFSFGYTIFPDIIIGQLTISQASIDDTSLMFIFYGVAILLPCIIAYTIFIYRVFHGKVSLAMEE